MDNRVEHQQRGHAHPTANEIEDRSAEEQAEERLERADRSAPAPPGVRRTDSDGDAVAESSGDRSGPAMTTKERVVGRTMAGFVVAAIVIGLVAAAIGFRDWFLLGIAALVFFAYALLLMAPAWLATTTKVAQDEDVRAQRSTGARRGAAAHRSSGF